MKKLRWQTSLSSFLNSNTCLHFLKFLPLATTNQYCHLQLLLLHSSLTNWSFSLSPSLPSPLLSALPPLPWHLLPSPQPSPVPMPQFHWDIFLNSDHRCIVPFSPTHPQFHCHCPNSPNSPNLMSSQPHMQGPFGFIASAPLSPLWFNQLLQSSTPMSLMPPQQPHYHPQIPLLPAQSLPLLKLLLFMREGQWLS